MGADLADFSFAPGPLELARQAWGDSIADALSVVTVDMDRDDYIGDVYVRAHYADGHIECFSIKDAIAKGIVSDQVLESFGWRARAIGSAVRRQHKDPYL